MAYTIGQYDPYDPEEIRRRQLLAPSGFMPENVQQVNEPIPAVQPPAQGDAFKLPEIPESEAERQYRELVAKQPRPEDYQAHGWRRALNAIVAGLAGAANPKFGVEVGNQLAYGPYERAMENWQTALKGAQGLSTMDMNRTSRQIQLAGAQNEARRVSAYEQNVNSMEKDRLDKQKQAENKQRALETYRDARIAIDQGKLLKPSDLQRQIDMIRGLDPTGATADDLKAYYEMKNAGKTKSVQREFIDRKMEEGATFEQAVEEYAKLSQKPQQPPQTLMFTPQGEAINVRPGTKVPAGSLTPQQQGTMDMPTTATRTMAEKAPRVKHLINRIRSIVADNEKQFGPLQGRMNEFASGKIGLPGKSWVQVRSNAMLLETALMNMHVGQRGGDKMMEHFRNLIGYANQDPENLKAILDEIDSYASEVAKEGGVKLDDTAETPSSSGTRVIRSTRKITPIEEK